ncbi:MAG: ACP S-malonyltransferase [Alphaproteobacteria bacterium]|nr:ACP S-malonyltransferase [Alphaproteobacteria bacterium]
MARHAFVFPGQGSQAVGMAKALCEASAAAREVLEEVDEALKQNLTRLMFEGPEEELVLTENAQPALMATSIAVLRTLEREGGLDLGARAAFVAGHSLGEYSALAAAGTFRLGAAARLLKRRGEAMQRAVPVGEGAMAAVLGLALDEVADIAALAAGDEEVCAPANDNAPGQIVISGHSGAIARAIALCAERGARRSVELPVSAPFHCALMAPAAAEMEEALDAVAMEDPTVPLVANVTAAPVAAAAEVKDLLVRQVTAMVRWRESVLALRDGGVDSIVEIGAGRVLSGLVRRIDRGIATASAHTPDEIESLLK